MSLGKRKRGEQNQWVATYDLPKSPGHHFYDKLNRLLDEAGFDDHVEAICEPYYCDGRGRPGVPPGVYFRMLLIGYFEGLDSQRGIAWRCSDSRSLQSFLGYSVTEETPDHSSLTRIRKRLPLSVHEDVFTFMLSIAVRKKLLKGKSVAVDSTFIEADAAMKSIVRRDNGDDWKEYLRKLMAEEGIDDPDDDDIRKFDQKRKNKRVSNEEWTSPNDPDARIARMKDGRTHMAYKAEHAIDLDSDIILAAAMYKADEGDTTTLCDTLVRAQAHAMQAGSQAAIKDVVADKGYHSNDNLAWCEEHGVRTHIPERKSPWRRKWSAKPAAQKRAVYGNLRRVEGKRGKQLGRLRSEYVERSFAHVCETGGARRTWLNGLIKTAKRYLITAAGKNLGVIMRALFNIGKPKTLQTGGEGGFSLIWVEITAVWRDYRAFAGDLTNEIVSGVIRPTYSLSRYAQRNLPAAA